MRKQLPHIKAPELRKRYEEIRKKISGIKISGYDITKRCNLRCEGCFFFEGEISAHYPEVDEEAWNAFCEHEKERGVNYPHFAGAEPALVKGKLDIAAKYWQTGLVYTNGTVRLSDELPFMLHVSVWGAPERDSVLRGRSVLMKALDNYKGENRAIFMMTLNSRNIKDVEEVVRLCADHGVRLSFNHYSPSRQYNQKLTMGKTEQSDTFRLSNNDDNLRFQESHLSEIKEVIARIMSDYPRTVVYSSHYNEYVNQPRSLFQLGDNGVAVNCSILNMPHHRQYRTDLSFSDDECCIANVNCADCRHYVSVYTQIMAGFKAYSKNESSLNNWLEVVETWCALHFPDFEPTGSAA